LQQQQQQQQQNLINDYVIGHPAIKAYIQNSAQQFATYYNSLLNVIDSVSNKY
jgi:hypothetical protein